MDALDAPRPRQKWGKAQKRAYAKEKAMEDLLLPPKNPPPAWLSDPSLLPKHPPGRKPKEEPKKLNKGRRKPKV
jgi:hypothetical protein